MTYAYAALTIDVISEYCFHKSFNHLDEPDFAPYVQEMQLRAALGMPLANQLPWLSGLMKWLPFQVRKLLNPDVGQMVEAQNKYQQLVLAVEKQRWLAEPDEDEESKQNSIFDDMFEADVPAEEKSIARLGVIDSTIPFILSLATHLLF